MQRRISRKIQKQYLYFVVVLSLEYFCITHIFNFENNSSEGENETIFSNWAQA
jgi:hypothetical protein